MCSNRGSDLEGFAGGEVTVADRGARTPHAPASMRCGARRCCTIRPASVEHGHMAVIAQSGCWCWPWCRTHCVVPDVLPVVRSCGWAQLQPRGGRVRAGAVGPLLGAHLRARRSLIGRQCFALARPVGARIDIRRPVQGGNGGVFFVCHPHTISNCAAKRVHAPRTCRRDRKRRRLARPPCLPLGGLATAV